MMAVTADFGIKYSQPRRRAAMQRDATLTQNAYSRFLSQQRGTRNFAKLDRGMTRGVEGMTTSFTRRGLGQSGIYNRGQADYAEDWTTGRQDIGDELSAALRAADFSDSQAWNSYQLTDADLEEQKQAEILATASQLSQFQPFLGG